MADLQVCLFGDPSIEIASEPVRFPSRAASSLFAFLLVGGARRIPRSLLAGTFWPELPEAKARRRLSHTLWQITSALDEESNVIMAERAVVGIRADHPGFRVDVWEFDRLVNELDETAGADRFSRLQEAAELASGNLCEGLYDDWVMLARERYRERYAHLLTELVRAHKSRGDLDRALETARLVVDLNPLSEEPHRELMRLLHLLGRTAESVEHYDQLQAMLLAEVGAEPDESTRALLDRLLSHGDRGPQESSEQTPSVGPGQLHLVGREPERAQLRRALDEATAGTGGLIVVEGEPGIGKSRLLEDLAESAEWRGFDVAVVPCRKVAGPFKVLMPAVSHLLPRLRVLQLAETVDNTWLAEISELLPQIREWLPDLPRLPSLGPAQNQSRRTEAVVRTIAAAAVVRPLLLVIEDLHDADDETLSVMAGLARIASSHPIVVAATFRPTDARARSDVWNALVAMESDVRHRLLLQPLDADAISVLAFESGFQVPSEVLEDIHRETGGNPLFVLETLRAVGETEIGDTELPVAPNIKDVISHRLTAIESTARRALEVVAVLGRPANLDELVTLSSHSSLGALSADLEELVRRSLLAEAGEDFALPHEQIRKVIYDEIASERRVAMHAEAANALADSPTVPSAELAWHAEAGELVSVAAQHHASAASEAYRASAYEQAAIHYGRAIDTGWLDRIEGADGSDFLFDYETSLSVIGDSEQRLVAVDLLESGAPDHARRGQAKLRRIQLMSELGRLDDAAEAADELISWAADNQQDSTFVAAVLARSTVYIEAGSASEALAMVDQLADRQATIDEQVAITAARARALQMLQRHTEALDAWSEAVTASVAAGDPVAEVDALGMSGVAAAESGDMALAVLRIDEGIDRSRQLGHQAAVARNVMNRATMLQHNDAGQALVDYAEADDIFAAIRAPRGRAFVATNVADLRQTLFGVDAVADAAWREALTAFEQMGNRAEVAHCELIAGRSAHAAGHLDIARAYLEGALVNSRSADRRFTEVQILGAIAQLDQTEGHLSLAHTNACAAIDLAEEIRAAQLLPSVYADRALIELDLGSVQDALISARAGVDASDEYSSGPHRPWWALVRAQRRTGDPAARESLARCQELVERFVRNLDADDRKRAFDLQPELARIRSAWEADQPQVKTVELPAANAPIGRPLRSEDYVTVLWTVSHPDDPPGATEARRVRLIRLTEEAAVQGGAPSIDHLSDALGVSRSTIRRALAELRTEGTSLPTRGSRG